MKKTDVLVVGGGIIGLAHAYLAARVGLRVVLIERNPAAVGASIRNFGMIWPVGQPAGTMLQTALRSRTIWQEVCENAGLWHVAEGSLHLAYHADELAVLGELAALPDFSGTEMLSPATVRKASTSVRPEGLLGGLYSPTEMNVDARQAIARLPVWLKEQLGVEIRFDTVVTAIELPMVRTTSGDILADRVVVCGGDDFQTLYPEVFASSGLTRCKLQMMATITQPGSWQLGPMLAAGLTLGHYGSFRECPSLEGLRKRLDQAWPEQNRWGIHVLVSQNSQGELILGDSHQYGLQVDPFDQLHIDDLVMNYLRGFFAPPTLQVSRRWHGVYAKHPHKPVFRAQPAPNVEVITGVGGAGMTLSFGLAEQTIRQWSSTVVEA